MIKLFVLLVQFALIIGRMLERRAELDHALAQVEVTLGKTVAEMVRRAIAARDAVSDDPDSVRNDPRNRDRGEGPSRGGDP